MTEQPKRHFFGTDGLRGRANQMPLLVEIAQKLGQAAGLYFQKRPAGRHQVLIGKDTRLSGYMLENALASGFLSVGMDVIFLGPLPTPGVAALTRSLRADLGVVISASHNPAADNGIKLFGPDGFKLSDEAEAEIEHLMQIDLSDQLAVPEKIGHAGRLNDAAGRYMEITKSSLKKGVRLNGLKIVVDCAHGAAYQVAPKVLWELGAEVIKIGCEPNGANINEGVGSTHPEEMCRKVVELGADCGIALDGDADRLLMADEKGQLIDGDQILALVATVLHKENNLRANAVVATVMSNLGLEKYLSEKNIKLERTAVGDRYVQQRMRELGANVGGEQSGHIILSDYSFTGDGLVAALQILAALVNSGDKASKLCQLFEPFPQKIYNLPLKSRTDPRLAKKIAEAKLWAEAKLAKRGRLVLRPSGTEPLLRVMVEADDAQLLEETMAGTLDILK
ncbi:phosphoglucosamine mutase [Acetobacteraceae bacterium]|nr:phosphoglucosamine mutase [Acetobacteraceae bacterium]